MADLSLLDPRFRAQVELVLRRCQERGYLLVPFFGLRSPQEQARLWRQSRTVETIEQTIKTLARAGALYLSGVLSEVGSHSGRWATNCLPGQSWHQHGLAVDCFVVGQGGHAVWNPLHDGYRVYAEQAIEVGLEAGYFWPKRDVVHIQYHAEKVSKRFTWVALDNLMREKFGVEGVA